MSCIGKRLLKRGAMTLVEMLIAVSIFGFIIASAYLLFRGFNKMFHRGEIESSYRQDVRILSEIFARDISSMCCGAQGNDSAFGFFSYIKKGRKNALCEIHYRLNNGILERAVESPADDNLATINGEFEPLIKGVSTAAFFYKTDHWQRSISSLPSVVKLDVEWSFSGRKYSRAFIENVMLNRRQE